MHKSCVFYTRWVHETIIPTYAIYNCKIFTKHKINGEMWGGAVTSLNENHIAENTRHHSILQQLRVEYD